VVCTGAAGRHESLLQGLSGAHQPNTCVRGRQPRRFRKGFDWHVVDVDGLQRFCVLRLERPSQAQHALADFGADVVWRSVRVRLELCGKRRERTLVCATASALVDGSVSEDPVEPRDERFLRHVVHALEVSRKRILENVLCSFPAAGAAFEEAEEGTVILDEQLYASVIELADRRVFVRFGSHPASIGIEAAAATTAKTRGSLSTGERGSEVPTRARHLDQRCSAERTGAAGTRAHGHRCRCRRGKDKRKRGSKPKGLLHRSPQTL
jgi:hypothetical protein